jgi:hypothetical protein
MKQFVIGMLAILALDVVAKIVLLRKRDASRTLTDIAFDAVFNVGLLIWGAWALGASQ